jgi:hypothetical protein
MPRINTPKEISLNEYKLKNYRIKGVRIGRISYHFTWLSEFLFTPKTVVPAGFEPTTHRLEICCSIQLSYGTIFTTSRGRQIRTADLHVPNVAR